MHFFPPSSRSWAFHLPPSSYQSLSSSSSLFIITKQRFVLLFDFSFELFFTQTPTLYMRSYSFSYSFLIELLFPGVGLLMPVYERTCPVLAHVRQNRLLKSYMGRTCDCLQTIPFRIERCFLIRLISLDGKSDLRVAYLYLALPSLSCAADESTWIQVRYDSRWMPSKQLI